MAPHIYTCITVLLPYWLVPIKGLGFLQGIEDQPATFWFQNWKRIHDLEGGILLLLIYYSLATAEEVIRILPPNQDDQWTTVSQNFSQSISNRYGTPTPPYVIGFVEFVWGIASNARTFVCLNDALAATVCGLLACSSIQAAFSRLFWNVSVDQTHEFVLPFALSDPVGIACMVHSDSPLTSLD